MGYKKTGRRFITEEEQKVPDSPSPPDPKWWLILIGVWLLLVFGGGSFNDSGSRWLIKRRHERKNDRQSQMLQQSLMNFKGRFPVFHRKSIDPQKSI
ncbi:MAG: hypothetical protein J7641_16040 [Cyanobacteria bacterium SID2]|nr:hypothetical protein [Cyanobacteria bacterium SID2]MBP0006096.1 hypothetical protein [Cyanobacteria bacterium SBC]